VVASEALMATGPAEPGVEGGVDLRCRMLSRGRGEIFGCRLRRAKHYENDGC
jgi:hypothetical protein